MIQRAAAHVCASLAAFLLLASGAALGAADDLPYLGNWSNGRGDTLVVTETTIRFADNRAVPYRDVTRATDGTSFELQITARGEVNAFPAKTLAVEVDGDSMKITSYASHRDYMQAEDPQSVVTWFKDDGSGEEDE